MSDPASTPKVEVYTKWGCPYCTRAKALLDSKRVPYEEIDVTMGGPKKAEMLERAPSHLTVPSIFIGGVHVGGSDSLATLEAQGRLDAMLGL